MGCVVNGPGESKYANIGISLPGLRENLPHRFTIDGELSTTLRGDNITQEFMAILDDYIVKVFLNTLLLLLILRKLNAQLEQCRFGTVGRCKYNAMHSSIFSCCNVFW